MCIHTAHPSSFRFLLPRVLVFPPLAREMSTAAVPAPWAAAMPPLPEDIDGRASDPSRTPALPFASPVGDIVCPLGPSKSPHLTTPAWGPPPGDRARKDIVCPLGDRMHSQQTESTNDDDESPSPTGNFPMGNIGSNVGRFPNDLCQIDSWAWEIGSGQAPPSEWSRPSTVHSTASRISNPTGDGLIPGLTDGQRLSTVKPASVTTNGGEVVVTLRKEVPQGYWDRIEIVLVCNEVQKRLTPTGIKKGRKLLIEVPNDMNPGDYDVRLSFGDKLIHGAIPLSIEA